MFVSRSVLRTVFQTPSLRDTLTSRKEKDFHARVVRCKFNSGMKGIYERDGIKIDVYSENAFDEVAKSFCVYMVDVERLAGANTVDSRTFKGNRKKFELSGARRK